MSRRLVLCALTMIIGLAPLVAQQTPPPAGRQGGQGRQGGPPRLPAMGGGACEDSPYNCPDAANPLTPPDTVWIEEMTWMDVRDAMKAGKKTIIIATGGIEPNGPWLALGKHNYVLRANCDATARLLGDALCAPIVPFVPEGRIDPPSSHMLSPGTISVTNETFIALLSDIVSSMKVHGFENIALIGDSGGNVRPMQTVADNFTKLWSGTPRVLHIPEHYAYSTVTAAMEAKGVIPKDRKSDGLHDDPTITMNMMVTDPQSVRWDARVKAGKATIDGVSIADRDKAIAIGKQIVAFRADVTAAAIKKATGTGR